jgi:hypothetical protein
LSRTCFGKAIPDRQVTCFFVSNKHCPAQSPRVGCYFCLDTKVTKKSSQQGGFFALKAFALQTGQNHGLQLFCPAALALSSRFCKNLLCPFLRSRPPLFCPLSPEAYLLTGAEKEFPTKNKPAPYLALATGFLNVYLKKVLIP